MSSTLPARILIQVRDGVPNELVAFDLRIWGTKPLAEDDPDRIVGAKVAHKVGNCDLIAGLAEAQRKLVKGLRDEDKFEINEPWLRSLNEWVLSS